METKNREEMAAKHPDVWIPVAEGDRLEGKVVDLDLAWSDQRNDFYPLLTVQTADSVVLKWHAFETVAINEVTRKQPLPGEQIVVTYLGESRAPKAGRNAAKLFKVSVSGRDPREAGKAVYGALQARGPAGQMPAPVEPDVPIADVGAPSGDLSQDEIPF